MFWEVLEEDNSVGSGQWAVGSGQWAVGSGQKNQNTGSLSTKKRFPENDVGVGY